MRLPRLVVVVFVLLVPWLIASVFNVKPQAVVYSTAWRQYRNPAMQKHPQSTIDAITTLLSFHPDEGYLWEDLGRQDMEAGLWRPAEAAFVEAANRDSLSPEGRYLLGETYWRSGDQAAAMGIWKDLVLSGAAPLKTFATLSHLQRLQSDLEGAASTLSAWNKVEPLNSRVLLELGILQALDHPKEAIQVLEQADSTDHSISAQTYPLRKALSNEGCVQQGECLFQVGRAFIGLGQWDLAVKALTFATTLTPGNADLWAFLGESLQHVGQDGGNALAQAANLNSGSTVVRAMEALYWRRNGKPETALSILKELSAAEPGNVTWQIELGNTLAEAGNLPEALAYFKEAVQIEPDNPLTWANLGGFCINYKVDLHDSGLSAARKYLLLAPEDPSALDLMGRILMEVGDMDGAERFFLNALQRDNGFPPAHLHLGQVYLQKSESDLAYNHLKQAQMLSGNYEEIGIIAGRLLNRFFPGLE